LQRLQHACHGTAAERGIAGEARLKIVAGDHAEHQPRAGAGVAEVEILHGRLQAADALTGHLHGPIDVADLSPERHHSLCCGQNIL
jgi:hypothetical protein